MENDKEYVASIGKHLLKDLICKCCESRKSRWSKFCLFLEKAAETAKMLLTSDFIISAISVDKVKKVKCNLLK